MRPLRTSSAVAISLVVLSILPASFVTLGQGGTGREKPRNANAVSSGGRKKGRPPAPPKCEVAKITVGPGVAVKNSLGMELVWIPPGKFCMGNDDEAQARPKHPVTIKVGFYMGRYEVTQAEWRQVMNDSPSYTIGEKLPVHQISYGSARTFIDRLNARGDGFIYQLPTEAQWEYACQIGDSGASALDWDAVAWYAANAGKRPLGMDEYGPLIPDDQKSRVLDQNGNMPHEVGTKRANALGLYDMHGNVAEWCDDSWRPDYLGAPKDGSAVLLPFLDFPQRVVRGGSWAHYEVVLHSWARSFAVWGDQSRTIGLRVVAIPRTP